MVNGQQDNGFLGHDNSHGEMQPSMGMVSESLALILWRSRWIVLATTVAALAAGLVYVTKATPIYTSTSRLYVEQSGPKIFTEMAEGVMTQSKNYLYTQAELLTSTPILTAVLDTPGLAQLQTFSGVDNHVSYLKKNIVATVGKKDDIISVSFDSPYPTEAAQVVNAVVDAYITYHATRKRSTSGEVLKILQAEQAKRSAELTAKLKAMVDFRNESPAVALENSRGNILVEQLQRWSELLLQAQLATIESESAYESTREMVTDPVKLQQLIEAQRATGAYISRDSERAELRSKLDQLEDRLADRLRQLTADHPAVTALKTEIAGLKAQITDLNEQFAQAQLAVAQQQYLAARQKQDQIADHYEQQRQEAVALNQQLSQYTLLESDYEQTKKLCDILDDRIKELNVTEEAGALNISILEYARAADKPSEPQKSRYMAIALVMGLMLGGGLGLLRDFLDQTLRSAEEISAVLGMPVLGVVPSMSRRESISTRGQKTHLDSKSQWAEAYRTIRTAVFFGAPKTEARTILITSPTPADGKTTLASNLSIAMAQAGQKVLILDADFRKPMQHRIFQLNHEDRGLSSILAGVSTVEESIQRTDVKGLDLLACGPNVPNPAEILNSEAFASLLRRLAEKYDRVVLDSPPVMSVTDAQILGALCNVTLLVLRAEKSTRRASQQARQGLLSVGAHVLGVIVNDVPKKSRYGYYGSYEYSYYGDGHRKRKTAGESPAGAVTALNYNAGADAKDSR